MENSRRPGKFPLSRDDQIMTWHHGMKEATRKLAAVGPCRLPGCGSRDLAHKWPSTLKDMARDRCQ